MNFSDNRKLIEIADRIDAGERLSFADGVELYSTNELSALGKLADTVRRRKHGRTTYFNVNRHFNPTNVCYADCKFCGFYRTPRQADAYTHNIDESLRIAGEAVQEGATELHIVGGLNTKLPFSYFTDLLSALKQQYPQLHLKAFTMVEIDHFAHFYKMSDEDVIQQLIESRRLVIVPRETPYNAIHLENMLRLARAGAHIIPASPGFYHRPQTIEALVDHLVFRILDHLGVPHSQATRWQGAGVEPKQFVSANEEE